MFVCWQKVQKFITWVDFFAYPITCMYVFKPIKDIYKFDGTVIWMSESTKINASFFVIDKNNKLAGFNYS